MIKLYTHTDLDGIGCAILATLAYADVDITYCDYNYINNKIAKDITSYEILRYDKVYITDISISEEIADMLDGISYLDIQLLDHHPTALFLNKYNWCNVQITNKDNIKTSGTELFYEYLKKSDKITKSNSLQTFVNIIRDYDTYRWAEELGNDGIICKQINDLFHLYGTENFINWCIKDIKHNNFPNISMTDEIILNIHQKEINQYIKSKNSQIINTKLNGRKCGIVFADRFISELGNKLCTMHPELDFIVMIDMDGFISYRAAKDDIDLGKDIAKTFGGGGHPKAAGSQFNSKIKKDTIRKIFENKISI